MTAPRNYKVGERVTITQANVEAMKSSNRSCVHPGYPCDSYIKDISRFIGKVGHVTHRFEPGYEMTIEFADGDDERRFHAKDSWVTHVMPDIHIAVSARSGTGKSALIQTIKEALEGAGLGVVEFSLDAPLEPRDAETLKKCMDSVARRNPVIEIHEQVAHRSMYKGAF